MKAIIKPWFFTKCLVPGASQYAFEVLCNLPDSLGIELVSVLCHCAIEPNIQKHMHYQRTMRR